MVASPCGDIGLQLGGLFECSQTARGHWRVRTPLYYPDGGIVDVFVLDESGAISVTDFGEALGWLRSQSVSGRRSPKQERLVADVCLTHGVELFRGQLLTRVTGSDLAAAVLRVAQAAVRVADIWFTLRTRAIETVTDEVADFLSERNVEFERGARLPGRSGRVWNIDFQTRAPTRSAFVLVLATGSRPAARRMTEHVVASWHDLSHHKISEPRLSFVSLFDDTEDVWSDEDFKLVEELSTVARWSRPDELEGLLKAA